MLAAIAPRSLSRGAPPPVPRLSLALTGVKESLSRRYHHVAYTFEVRDYRSSADIDRAHVERLPGSRAYSNLIIHTHVTLQQCMHAHVIVIQV
jgi:hypothetical protein